MTCQIFRNSWYFTQKISLKKKFLYFKLEEKTRNYKEAVSMSFRNKKNNKLLSWKKKWFEHGKYENVTETFHKKIK